MRNLALTLIALGVVASIAACGGGDYQAPPKANERKVDQYTGGGGDTGGPAPTGPSRTKEFNAEARKAQDAWKGFARNKTADTYAICGAHIYNALRYRIEHERNGHSSDSLRGLRELNRLRTDWAKSEGQLTTEQKKAYEQHSEYKAAKQAYDDIQS